MKNHKNFSELSEKRQNQVATLITQHMFRNAEDAKKALAENNTGCRLTRQHTFIADEKEHEKLFQDPLSLWK